MRTLLETLTCAPGISGREYAIADTFSALLAPYVCDIRRDALGNVTARRRGFIEGRKTLLLEAHMDKIGLMVRHITEDGFLLVSPIGGLDTKTLPAMAVRIFGREVLRGVICAVAPHVATLDKAPEMDMLCIDTGLSPARVREAVSVGDVMEFITEFTPLGAHKISASALDDRAGLAILVEVLRLLEKEELPFNIAICGAAQEEVGLRGAGTAAYTLSPYAAFCIDVCHGESPDASGSIYKLGKGPAITVGPNVQRSVSDALIASAKRAEIPYQIDVDSGNTGTDAWPVQAVRCGIYTGLLSLPLRYMHTGYEVIDIRDVENTAALLLAVIKDLGKQGELCF